MTTNQRPAKRVISPEELKAMYDRHQLWLWRDPNGVQLDLSNTNLVRSRWAGCSLSGADFTGADLTNADLAHADVKNARFDKANCASANFTGADMRRATFRETDLTGAAFPAANLDGIDVTGANLTAANLRGASHNGVDFSTAAHLPESKSPSGTFEVGNVAPTSPANRGISHAEGVSIVRPGRGKPR